MWGKLWQYKITIDIIMKTILKILISKKVLTRVSQGRCITSSGLCWSKRRALASTSCNRRLVWRHIHRISIDWLSLTLGKLCNRRFAASPPCLYSCNGDGFAGRRGFWHAWGTSWLEHVFQVVLGSCIREDMNWKSWDFQCQYGHGRDFAILSD